MRREADAQTVRRAQQGDEQARSELAAHAQEVFRRALGRRGVSGDAAEDVSADALAIVLRKLPEFRFAARFETWALAILFRVEQRFNENEKKRRNHTVLAAELADEEDPDPMSREAAVEGSDADPPSMAFAASLREALADCLGAVAISMREVWVRHRIRGDGHEEIARDLGMKTATVGTRIWRVDGNMRKCLETKGFTAEVLGIA